ncbi:DUF2920 family protein [Campylobacter mucosalis]|uniref:Putative DUF2920 domain protein n=1 Tax=Campylobacter mucosalis CCUG 21559 TaxID=1032067 RepID=A0A6G5QEV1_9BACT|nr:DUF2920 family protein [Campylobacter mucosalis]QCD44181.1 putative DUF2920 domain protein [Campylobacter mucosalis CCUG 21559]
MLVNQTYEISSCDDVELGIKRDSKLEFRLCYDDSQDLKAIVFIVPGLGGDVDEQYREHLAQGVAADYGVAVVSVNYHCIGNRPHIGAGYTLDEIDWAILQNSLKTAGMVLPPPIKLENFTTLDTIAVLLQAINDDIEEKKLKNELDSDFKMGVHLSLVPTKGEYQNFGIMQSLDILNALLFVKNLDGFSNLPVVMVGGSHGGYLAHMTAKMAPWLIDGVIDNSSYAKHLWRLIGFGKQIDYRKFSCYMADNFFKNINVYASDKTHWTLDKNSPNYFSPAHEEIRDILNLAHLKTQSEYKKPIYISYHCTKDTNIAPADDKARLYEILNSLGFDATLNMISDESQIDGRFIKSLSHGMGMSYKLLIQKELSNLLSKINKTQISSKNSISYISDDKVFKFSQEDDRIKLEISLTK